MARGVCFDRRRRTEKREEATERWHAPKRKRCWPASFTTLETQNSRPLWPPITLGWPAIMQDWLCRPMSVAVCWPSGCPLSAKAPPSGHPSTVITASTSAWVQVSSQFQLRHLDASPSPSANERRSGGSADTHATTRATPPAGIGPGMRTAIRIGVTMDRRRRDHPARRHHRRRRAGRGRQRGDPRRAGRGDRDGQSGPRARLRPWDPSKPFLRCRLDPRGGRRTLPAMI